MAPNTLTFTATATCGFTIDQDASNEGNETIALAFASGAPAAAGSRPLTTITSPTMTGRAAPLLIGDIRHR
ncbi:hypothetical protein [Candidatus Amarobacter glycogenicus]|uniref:hypothetical protein n=1 Tax=Candidatus Amarobacter glycogenicus TaxID=3140699 RepID=UPI003135FCA5|nr:hypothetical protein [Dehalococcoidia bacterium]